MWKTSSKDLGTKATILLMFLVGILTLFFYGGFGYQLANDSMGYIQASYEREPLYPLIIMIFRRIFTENGYLYALTYFQRGFALFTALYCAFRIKKILARNSLSMLATYCMFLIPFFLDSCITHFVLTEGFAYALFELFLLAAIEFITTRNQKYYVHMLILVSLMVLLRSQLMVCYVTIGVICLLTCFNLTKSKHHNLRRFGVQIAAILAAVCITTLLSYVYCYSMWGDFKRSSENDFTKLTNLLYASDEEDVNLFADKEEQDAFLSLYSAADASGYLHQYAGKSMTDNANHLCNSHDPIKYDIVRPFFTQMVEEKGLEQSFQSDHLKKELASSLSTKLMKKHFYRWLYDGFCMIPKGMVLVTALFIKPGYTWISTGFTIFFWFITVILLLLHMKHDYIHRNDSAFQKERNHLIIVLSVLFFIIVNVLAVGTFIFVISRYTNYTQGIVFLLPCLLARDVYRYIKSPA